MNEELWVRLSRFEGEVTRQQVEAAKQRAKDLEIALWRQESLAARLRMKGKQCPHCDGRGKL